LYDVNNRKTFESVEEIFSFVKLTIPLNHQNVVILGNKIDLGMEMREVTKEEIQILQRKLSVHFFECSCKLNLKINDPIHLLMKGFIHSKEKRKECHLM
jgi:GTPase SAR1 family protein